MSVDAIAHAQHFNITNRPALLSNTRDDPIYKTAFIPARWAGGYFDNDHVDRWGEESTHGFKDTDPKSLIAGLLVALDRLKPQHSPSYTCPYMMIGRDHLFKRMRFIDDRLETPISQKLHDSLKYVAAFFGNATNQPLSEDVCLQHPKNISEALPAMSSIRPLGRNACFVRDQGAVPAVSTMTSYLIVSRLKSSVI